MKSNSWLTYYMVSLGVTVMGIFVAVMVLLGRTEPQEQQQQLVPEKELVVKPPEEKPAPPVPVAAPTPVMRTESQPKPYTIICREGFEYYSDLGAPRFDPVTTMPRRCP